MNEIEHAPATVLYVDDEAMACKYFVRAMSAECLVLTAESADAAMKILHAVDSQVDVVVTDFRMPGRDGGDLLREIEREFPHVVRILVTAHADKDLLLKAVNSGDIFRILEKPLDVPEMKISLRKAIELARSRHERINRFMAIDETLGFLAHELNTPLAAISNFSRGIQRRFAKGDATRDEQLEVEKVALAMQNNARYCLTVLAAFVDSVRRAGTPAFEHAEPTIKELIDSLLDIYPLSAAQRAMIEVQIVDNFRIVTLPNCVSLVLSSILTNSLRALRETAEPRLQIIASIDTHPRLKVVDNGPGIPANIMEKLLQDPVTTHAEAGGSGWGLIFCRRIMQSFGGDIRIESEVGKFTCMSLDFPAVENHAKRSA